MLRTKPRFFPQAIAVFSCFLLFARPVAGLVIAFCLDTSGSMRQHFAAARQALLGELRALRAGDIAYVIRFDINDELLGRVVVGEDGLAEGLEELEKELAKLQASGRYTNVDECLDAAKVKLFEEGSVGERAIVIVSDGISDPDPHHIHVDLKTLGEVVPETLGVNVYLVSLRRDLYTIFEHSPATRGRAGHDPAPAVLRDPKRPHLVGVPFDERGIGLVLQGLRTPMRPKASEPSASPTARPIATATSTGSPTASVRPTALSSTATSDSGIMAALPLGIGALLMGCAIYPLLRRSSSASLRFVATVSGHGTSTMRFPFTLVERAQISAGPNGDLPLPDPDLTGAAFTLRLERGGLWLTPLDDVTVNGVSAIKPTTVRIGDIISVRQQTAVGIEEGEDEQ